MLSGSLSSRLVNWFPRLRAFEEPYPQDYSYMRIFYDHQLFSLQNAGGASRYHYELMRHLSSAPDVRVELLLGLNETVYPFQELSTKNTRVTGFRGPLGPGILRYAANEALSNAILPFRGTMDVYHPTSYRCMPLVRSRRLVTTHHDCTHERFSKAFRYFDEVVRAKKLLFKRADAIICVSEASRKDLLEYYDVEVAKTHVIYHGLTHLPRSLLAAEKLRSIVKRDYLLYVGSRAPYKNFPALLKAFRAANLQEELGLLVLGGGPLIPEEAIMAERLELNGSLTTIPRVSDELLAEAYAGARLFVYPSRWEGFGLPPLEAMSLDCPVAASRISSVPEVCKDAPFYFDPEDSESLERVLANAATNNEARKQAIARGRSVAAQYTWQKCAQETLRLYRNCQ